MRTPPFTPSCLDIPVPSFAATCIHGVEPFPVLDDEGPIDAAVQQMLRGDEEAFRVVYRAVQPGLQRYLTVLVGWADAEDVASETWGQAARDLHTFSGDADGFRGWITTIGRHRALDHLRAKGRRPMADMAIDDLPERASRDDVEGAALESLSTDDAIRLIGSLPQEQAEAVLMRAVLGLDAKTAGKILGRSAGAVRTAAYRGLRALADRLPNPASDTSESPDAEELR
ncbi:MAG: polymerase, sigma-24 subunit, subfamily [Marmoricola sp.]|nr:polymerase, sigma-24 subunit, subfamily [Marmoricola sp.]